MSKLDKDQVLADYSAAYLKAHGKQPNIEAKGGWYSVDGGKNMRLAQLAEATAELGGATGSSAAPAKAKVSAKKAAAKPAVAPKKAVKVSKSGGGLSAKELWKQRLEQDQTLSRLPRGYDE